MDDGHCDYRGRVVRRNIKNVTLVFTVSKEVVLQEEEANGRHVRYIIAWHSGTIPMLTCAFQQRQNYSKGERKIVAF